MIRSSAQAQPSQKPLSICSAETDGEGEQVDRVASGGPHPNPSPFANGEGLLALLRMSNWLYYDRGTGSAPDRGEDGGYEGEDGAIAPTPIGCHTHLWG